MLEGLAKKALEEVAIEGLKLALEKISDHYSGDKEHRKKIEVEESKARVLFKQARSCGPHDPRSFGYSESARMIFLTSAALQDGLDRVIPLLKAAACAHLQGDSVRENAAVSEAERTVVEELKHLHLLRRRGLEVFRRKSNIRLSRAGGFLFIPAVVAPAMGPIGAVIGGTSAFAFFGCWLGRVATDDYRDLIGKIKYAHRKMELCLRYRKSESESISLVLAR